MKKKENAKFSISIEEIMKLQGKGLEVQVFVNGKYYNYVDTSYETNEEKEK